MVGLGGGIFFIPILIKGLGYSTRTSIAASIFAMVGTTVSSTIAYLKYNKVDFKLALLYDIFDIPGVIVGATLTTMLLSSTLTSICGIVVIILAVLLIISTRKKKTRKKSMKGFWNPKSYILAGISSFFSGIVTGLAGMGGGTTDTLTMMLLGAPARISIGSSELAMTITNIAGILSHGFIGNLNLDIAVPLGIGAVIGGQIGARLSSRVKTDTLKKALAVIALLVGIRLLF